MNILMRDKAGTLRLRYAYWSYRRGPIGEWFVGSVPLSELPGEVIATDTHAVTMFEGATASEVEYAMPRL